ncbi:MAG: hypothetical protein WBP72_01430 [Rhodocyclaceae bacterium]
MTRTVLAITWAVTVLAGCGAPDLPPPKPSPSVVDPQFKALEQAKGIEQTLKDQAAAQRREIDEAEKP